MAEKQRLNDVFPPSDGWVAAVYSLDLDAEQIAAGEAAMARFIATWPEAAWSPVQILEDSRG